MIDILYTIILTLFIMVLLHHLYNYLQTNLTVPKVNEMVNTTILNDLQEVQDKGKQEKESDELKEYMNQFKKK
jgi:hypothetical protein